MAKPLKPPGRNKTTVAPAASVSGTGLLPTSATINGTGMAKLDITTLAEYLSAAEGAARAQVVVDALANAENPAAVAMAIRNGSGTAMASATMVLPWATQSQGTITIGEVAGTATVSTGGTPDATWYVEFTSGTRYVRCTFGLPGSGAEFVWSLPTFAAGQTFSLGTVRLTSVTNSAPQWVNAPGELTWQAGQPFSWSPYATDVDGDTLTFALVPPYPSGYTITTGGLMTVGTVTGRVQVRVSDGPLTADHYCAVTVAEQSPAGNVVTTAVLAKADWENRAIGEDWASGDNSGVLRPVDMMMVGSTQTNYPTTVTSSTRGTSINVEDTVFVQNNSENPAFVSSGTGGVVPYRGVRMCRNWVYGTNYAGANSSRSEHNLLAPELGQAGPRHPGAPSSWENLEHYIGFALWLDTSWPSPQTQNTVHFQIHYRSADTTTIRNAILAAYPGDTVVSSDSSPCWYLRSSSSGVYQFGQVRIVRSGTTWNRSFINSSWSSQTYAGDRGQWVRWAFHVKYHKTAGFIRAYRATGTSAMPSQPVAEITGETYSPFLPYSTNFGYYKFGNYTSSYKSSPGPALLSYRDSVRIADLTGNVATVDPLNW